MSCNLMAPVTGVQSTATCVPLHHLIRSGRRKMIYQDNPQPPLEDEVFDAENFPVDMDMDTGQPDSDEETERDGLREEMLDSPAWLAQKNMGKRKMIEVLENGVTIDGKELTPKEFALALQDSFTLFGPFTLAVDEYKDGSRKMFAISQALVWKGVDLSRTVTSVRLSAVREIYGFLVNKGQGDRVIMLVTYMLSEDKRALENPRFFHSNKGYDQT